MSTAAEQATDKAAKPCRVDPDSASSGSQNPDAITPASNPELGANREDGSSTGRDGETVQKMLQNFTGGITQSFIAKRKQSVRDINASFKSLGENLQNIFLNEQKLRETTVMPPKPVKPRGRPRKYLKVDPDPSTRNWKQLYENNPGLNEKLLHERKKQSEVDVSATVNSIEQKIDHFISLCRKERQRHFQDYSQEFLTMIVICNIDGEKVKEHREKMANLLEEQQDLFQQFQAAQNQKMEEFKELCEQYLKSLENVEDCRRNAVAKEIRKQMAILDKKVVPESNVKGMTGDRGSFLGGGRSEMEKKVSKVPERVIEETEHQNMILIDKYFQSLTLEGSEDSM